MQPVVYSEKTAALPGGCGWHRAGTDIRYKPGQPRPKPLNDGINGDDPTSNTDDEDVKQGMLQLGWYKLLRKRVLRARASLTSRKQGVLAAKAIVKVTEITQLMDNTNRNGALRGRCGAGWFTMRSDLLEILPAKPNVCGDVEDEATVLLSNSELMAPQNDFLEQQRNKRKKTKRKKGDSWVGADCFYQLEVTLVSEHANDTLYVAMAVPYSYTKLQQRLRELVDGSPHATRRQLCTTRGGRRCDVVTITQAPRNPTLTELPRRHIVLSARVHPGETNASWQVSAYPGMLNVFACIATAQSYSR